MTSRISIDVHSLDRVLIVCNPSAGSRHRSDDIRELVAALQAQGLSTEIASDLNVLGERCRQLQSSGQLRAVIAAGGDGTVAEVVNRTEASTPVTVFPLGTANLLAGYFGIRRNPQQMARMIAERTLVQLDAGRANGRIFLLMAGCGLDAEVVRRMHARRGGGHISYWSWAPPALEAIRKYTYPNIRVSCQSPADPDGTLPAETVETVRWAFAVNLPVYAVGLRMALNARADDGEFDVCTFRHGSFWHFLKYVSHLLLRRHHLLADYGCQMATRVRIESDEPVPYQLDGDPGGMLPLEIEMLPSRLCLLVPQAQAQSLGLKTITAQPVGA